MGKKQRKSKKTSKSDDPSNRKMTDSMSTNRNTMTVSSYILSDRDTATDHECSSSSSLGYSSSSTEYVELSDDDESKTNSMQKRKSKTMKTIKKLKKRSFTKTKNTNSL